MPVTTRDDFKLGRWTVQPSRHRLCDAETSCQLSHKAMAVLLHLAADPGRVVSKDELAAEVWRGAFTSDEALTTVVYELRKALGDNARQPRYVETIRKGGYRLIAPIEPLVDPAADPLAPVGSPEPPRSARAPGTSPAMGSPAVRPTGEIQPPRTRVPWIAVAVAAGLAVIVLIGLPRLRASHEASVISVTTDEAPGERERGVDTLGSSDVPVIGIGVIDPETLTPPPSLAVLPLSSFGDQCRQDSFAGTLTEMLIADLAAASPIEVLPSLTTRGIDEDWSLEQIAEKLDADLVVEGTVVRGGERIWLSIQLVDIATGRMVWGGTYERPAAESLGQQRALAIEIAEELGRHALPSIVLPEAPHSPPGSVSTPRSDTIRQAPR